MTEREIVREWLKCDQSFLYWLAAYVYILDATAGAWVRFEPWPAQRDLGALFTAHRLLIILKARQLGITWLVLAWALWLMLFRPAAIILIFSRRDDESIYLLGDERLKGMYKRLPPWMQCRAVVVDSGHEWRLSNGSSARAFPTTGGDSYTATLAIVDESDLIPSLGKFMRSVKPTIDGGGQMILLSRPDKDAPASEFKAMYRAAVKGDSPYHPVFLPWSARPSRDAAWYAEIVRDAESRGALDDVYEQYPATPEEALALRTLGRRVYDVWAPDNITADAEYEPGAGPVFWSVDDGDSAGPLVSTRGIDPATGSYHPDAHPRVFGLFQLKPTGQIAQFAEHHGCMIPMDEHIRQVIELGYPEPEYAVVGPGSSTLRRMLNARGIAVQFGGTDVEESIKTTKLMIGPSASGVRGLIVHPRCTLTIAEMLTYVRDAKTGKPAKAFDHAMDMIRYLIWKLRKQVGG